MCVRISGTELNYLNLDNDLQKKLGEAKQSNKTDNVVFVSTDIKQLVSDLEGATKQPEKDIYVGESGSNNLAKISKDEALKFLAHLKVNMGNSQKIITNYLSEAEIPKLYKANKDTKAEITTSDVNNIQKRIEFVDKISQNDNIASTKKDGQRCGSACIVAAAMIASGMDGLKEVVKTIKEDPKFKNLPNKNILNNIDEKLKAGKNIEKTDISHIQEALFKTIDNNQEWGLSGAEVKTFLRNNMNLVRLLEKNDATLLRVNLNDNLGSHVVLKFKDPTSNQISIYDPWDQKSAKQIITDPEKLKLYTEQEYSGVLGSNKIRF